LTNHHIVSVTNEDFDIRTPQEVAAGAEFKDLPPTEFSKRAFAAFTRASLVQGRNPTAVKIAAQAYAHHQEYPEKPITLIGHSAGGIASHEAAEILQKMGVKVKVVALGSPYFGLTEPTEDTVTLASKKDPIIAATGNSVMKGMWFNDVEDHSINAYFTNPESNKFLKAHLGPPAKKDSIRSDKGKPCGESFIAANKVCDPKKTTTARSPQPAPITKLTGIVSPVVRNGILAGVALTGLSTAAYMTQRARFQAGFKTSAEIAKKEAEQYTVPPKLQAGFRSSSDQGYKESETGSHFSSQEPEQISFFVGGFGGVSGKEGDFLGEEFAQMFPKHHTVAIESPEFDITAKEGDRVYKPDFLARAAKTMLGAALEKGRNPVATRIAARAYAYSQKYPDKPINLIGQSGGTMQVREAAEILDRMGVKGVRVVGTAGPYFGMTKPNGMTLISKKDPVNAIFGASMPNKQYVNSVAGHSTYYVTEGDGSAKKRADLKAAGQYSPKPQPEVQKVLSDYFDRSKRQDAALTPLASNLNPDRAKMQSRFLLQLKTILERSYTNGVDQFLGISIKSNGDIDGRFRDGRNLVDFAVTAFDVSTKFVTRGDAYLDALETELQRDHLERSLKTDATRGARGAKPKNCITGLACRGACIDPHETCRVPVSSVASAQEMMQLRQSALSLRSPSAGGAPTPPGAVPGQSVADPLQDLKIRDLKKIAKEKNIYRYGAMTSAELKKAIATTGERPAQQRRVEKTLTRNREFREAIEGTSINKAAKDWNKFKKIVQATGVSPEIAAGAAIAFISGLGIREYMKLRDRYRDGYVESAKAATDRAEKTPVQPIEKPNITFAVGGFTNEGSSGDAIKAKLEGLADKKNADQADQWFRDQNEIIPFNAKAFDIPKTDIPPKNPDGTYNPAYLGHLAKHGFGGFIQNNLKKRNEDSVELAAQIYAHATARDENGNYVNKNKPINIIAHSAGGLTADEALQVINRMPNGKEILDRVNLVKMGTPNVGYIADTKPTREMSITSAHDPLNLLPARNAKQINSVRGRELDDYLDNQEVIEQIRTMSGYHSSSTFYQQSEKKRKKENPFDIPPTDPTDPTDPRNSPTYGRNPANAIAEAQALAEHLKERAEKQKEAAKLAELLEEVQRVGRENERKAEAEQRKTKKSGAAKKGWETRRNPNYKPKKRKPKADSAYDRAYNLALIS
jgi:pimeloyl-ACP methyl ester carboxylesterase